MAPNSDLSGICLELDHKYQVGDPIRRGPMATLYHASWELFSLPVFVRSYESLVSLRLRHRDTARIRWDVETEVGKVRGPGLPDVIDAGIEDPTRPFLVLRLPEGDLLINRLREQGALRPDEAVRMVSSVAEALEHCRDVGMLHRGPTADRVWVTPTGEATLLGLGEVLYRDDTVSMSATPRTELLWHIPPESFAASQADDEEDEAPRLRGRGQGAIQGRELEDAPAAEVYTLACLAYHALNGHHPFFIDIDDPTEGINATRRDTPLELNQFDVHSDVWRVVSRALSRDPADRYASPAAFAEAFADAVAAASPTKLDPIVEDDADLADIVDAAVRSAKQPVVVRQDSFQLWAWRFAALVAIPLVCFLLVRERFRGQTLLIMSDPPGIEIGEEIGYARESLGKTPVLLFGRDLASPLRLFAIGPDGFGETSTYDVGRFHDLGRCRATELAIEYPEFAEDSADDSAEADDEPEAAPAAE